MTLIHPPPTDPTLFDALLEILDYCCAPTRAQKNSFNDRAVSRVLVINPRTLTRMREQGDDWPWWNSVLRDAIAYILPHVPKWKRRKVAKMMRLLPEEMVEKIELACAARDYIIEILKDGPVMSRTVLSTANRGNLSENKIKRAAKAMGVIKTRLGKGHAHRVYWELPHWDEGS